MADTERPPVTALDADGVVVVSVLTGLWLVALIVLLALHRQLSDAGRLWWIAAAAVGAGLGLLGIGYCLRRRNRLAASA